MIEYVARIEKGFVEMANEDGGKSAIENLNGIQMDGKEILVKESDPAPSGNDHGPRGGGGGGFRPSFNSGGGDRRPQNNGPRPDRWNNDRAPRGNDRYNDNDKPRRRYDDDFDDKPRRKRI